MFLSRLLVNMTTVELTAAIKAFSFGKCTRRIWNTDIDINIVLGLQSPAKLILPTKHLNGPSGKVAVVFGQMALRNTVLQ